MLASPGYFKLMRIPQLSGRDFNDSDNAQAPLPCIINQALAAEAFPNEDPIGHRVHTGLDGTGMMTVVGVVVMGLARGAVGHEVSVGVVWWWRGWPRSG